jgi:undecaprenyl-diphosphatase
MLIGTQFTLELVLYLKAMIMGLVEGLTEFVPVSSTGHLILAGALLRFEGDKVQVFEIVVQTGAMFAIIWEYRAKFITIFRRIFKDSKAKRFIKHIAIAFAPAAMLGVAFGKYIKVYLFSPVPVAVALVIGGLFILWVEKRNHRVSTRLVEEMTWVDALKIGLAQCFALIPGTSRAGATIIGGLLCGLSRPAATEFSFFLAIPTLIAAGGYELYKEREALSANDSGWFCIGTVAAFMSAFLTVRWLLRYVGGHTFVVFAWYRIVFGVIVLATTYTQVVQWTHP